MQQLCNYKETTLSFRQLLWTNFKRCLRSRATWQDWRRWWRFYDYKHLVHAKLEGQTMTIRQYASATSDVIAHQEASVWRGFWYWMTGAK